MKKQLDGIAHGVQNLQNSQDAFKGGTYGRLDAIGTAVGSIEVTLHELVQQSSITDKPTFKPSPEFGRTLLPYVRPILGALFHTSHVLRVFDSLDIVLGEDNSRNSFPTLHSTYMGKTDSEILGYR